MAANTTFAHGVLAGAIALVEERPDLVGVGLTDLALAVVSAA